jgi:hypothetical protein
MWKEGHFLQKVRYIRNFLPYGIFGSNWPGVTPIKRYIAPIDSGEGWCEDRGYEGKVGRRA